MLDIKQIRESPELIVKNLKKRKGFDVGIVDKVLDVDLKWREEKKALDGLKSKKNSESKKISEVKKKGENIKKQLDLVKKISLDIEKKQVVLDELLAKRDSLLCDIPNLLMDDVPVGVGDEGNVEIRKVGKIKKFSFKPRNHMELCEMNDWYDLDTAARTSGARFYYLKNELLMLEVALYSYVLQKLSNKGYVPVEVPPMLRRDVLSKSISLNDFEEVIYKIEDEDLYLIGTSEHALAAIWENKTLANKDLPMRYAGLSPCYRKEAGVTKDSKGIFRVHNFNKIEQFVFSKPEESLKMFDELAKNVEEIYGELEIPYRIVNICSGDIGNFAAKKYDLEAYLPGQEKYRELCSTSNYTDYSARRLNCRYQDEKNELKFVHTLNSTAIALQRTIIAIIENHQTKDGNVKLPKVLVPFYGKEFLIEK